MKRIGCPLNNCSHLADLGTQDGLRELFANIFLLPHQREEYYKMLSADNLKNRMALAIKVVHGAINESNADIFFASMGRMGNEYIPYAISMAAQVIARALMVNRIFDELVKEEETKNV